MDAGSIVRVLRQRFYGDHLEYEFIVVMDVTKEREEIAKELTRNKVGWQHFYNLFLLGNMKLKQISSKRKKFIIVLPYSLILSKFHQQ